MENIIVPFYEITVPDELLLKGYSKTTAIDNPRLDNEGRSCQIYDVGGRRTELKKWLTYFQGVDTIIFEVSLTAYCQVLPGTISMVGLGRAFFALRKTDCFLAESNAGVPDAL